MITIRTNLDEMPEGCFDCKYCEHGKHTERFKCTALMSNTGEDYIIPEIVIDSKLMQFNCPLIDSTSVERAITCVEASFIDGLQAMAELKNNIKQEEK